MKRLRTTLEGNRYHIHIDAKKKIPQIMKEKAIELGFFPHHFIGHPLPPEYPKEYAHFEPLEHMAFKSASLENFNRVWSELETIAAKSNYVGYLEGEVIPQEYRLEENEFNPKIILPFQLQRRKLSESEKFRQTELHLVLDKDASDRRLIIKLLDAGLYGAFLPKETHTALILTAQGNISDVREVFNSLHLYLQTAGGVINGKIKEEVALRHALFGMESCDLPEIIDKISIST